MNLGASFVAVAASVALMTLCVALYVSAPLTRTGDGAATQLYHVVGGADSCDAPVVSRLAPREERWPQVRLVPSVNDTLDIVYRWVNGSDDKWQRRRETVLRRLSTKVDHDAASPSRFADNNELLFSLRSLEKYGTEFRVGRVYVLTSGQVPRWMKACPSVTIVFDSDLFPNRTDVPTFNTNALNLVVHRIPHLAENFILIDDDVLLGRRLQRSVLVSGDAIVAYVEMWESGCGDAFSCSISNTNRVLRATFKRSDLPGCCPTNAHAPMLMNREVLYRMEEQWPELYARTRSHKFRHREDLNLYQLYTWYVNGMKLGVVRPVLYDRRVLSVINANSNGKGLENLNFFKASIESVRRALDASFVCFNNGNVESPMLQQFLAGNYPVRAPSERGQHCPGAYTVPSSVPIQYHLP